jgi:hypothetical protein
MSRSRPKSGSPLTLRSAERFYREASFPPGLPSALCNNGLVSLPPLWTYLVCIWLRSSYLLRLTHARCKHQREGCDELYTLSGIDAGRAHD